MYYYENKPGKEQGYTTPIPVRTWAALLYISSCTIPRASVPWLLLFLILPSPTHTHLNCRPWSEQLVILVYFWLLFFIITDHVYTLARTFWFKNIHTCTKWRHKFAVSGYCRNILVVLCTWQCTTQYSVPPCTGSIISDRWPDQTAVRLNCVSFCTRYLILFQEGQGYMYGYMRIAIHKLWSLLFSSQIKAWGRTVKVINWGPLANSSFQTLNLAWE